MPNSNSELTQPQNILQNRLKYLSATLVISSVFIVIWAFFARLSVNSMAVGFILPAFSVKTILSTADGTVKNLSSEQSAELVRVLDNINTPRIKDSVMNYANSYERYSDNYDFESTSYTSPIATEIPKLSKYLSNINNLLELTEQIEASSSNLPTTLRPKRASTNSEANEDSLLSGQDVVSNTEICYKKGDPIYIQEDQQREMKLKQATSNALVKLSIFRSTYSPLQSIYVNEVKQNIFLKQLTSEANKLAQSKAITKNKYLDLQTKVHSSNSEILSSLKDKQALQVQLIEAFYSLVTAYVEFKENAYVKAESDICVFQRMIPDRAVVGKSELLALAIPRSTSGIGTRGTNIRTNNLKQYRSNSSVYDIPFFYLANTDQGIKTDDIALVYPTNVPRNTYGGIKGKVIDSGRVLANKSSIKWITGLSDISPFTSKNSKDQTMYFGVIRLTQANTFTRYKWTSGKGPSYPILLGTAADIVIQVSTQSPISNILPSVRSVTGLSK